MTSTLIELGADPNAADRFNATALWHAAALGNAGMVRLLVDAGANPDLANLWAETPLMEAISKGHIQVDVIAWGEATKII